VPSDSTPPGVNGVAARERRFLDGLRRLGPSLLTTIEEFPAEPVASADSVRGLARLCFGVLGPVSGSEFPILSAKLEMEKGLYYLQRWCHSRFVQSPALQSPRHRSSHLTMLWIGPRWNSQTAFYLFA